MKKKYTYKTFYGYCRYLIDKTIPKTSFLYKWLYLNGIEIHSKVRNKRKECLSFKYHTVDGCNLNCIGCSTCSPLVNNSFVDIESFESDIKQITMLGRVEMMELIGGEVLLHPNIIELLEISRKYIEKGDLAIVTNGILLPKQDEEFWKCCKQNRIAIKITPYPIKLDTEKITEMAKRYEIDLSYYSGVEKVFFCKCPLNIEGRGNIIKNFKRCESSWCETLRDGKMYGCYRAYCIKFFNEYYKQDFKTAEKDYKDIYKVKDVDELLDFMCKPIPFCRYCDIDNTEFRIPWKISRKEISEWM